MFVVAVVCCFCYDITQDLPHIEIYLIIFFIHLINVIFHDRVEKIVSGKYLSEVARSILAKLTRLGSIFGGQLPKALIEEWIFTPVSCAKLLKGMYTIYNSYRQTHPFWQIDLYNLNH